MSKKVLLILTICIFTLTASNVLAVQRMPVGELFTNTSCGPCYNANIALDGIVEDHWDELLVVRYHTWWPSSGDPFYQHNVAENQTRTNYYGADYVPHFWVDGVDRGSGYSGWASYIQGRMGVSSPLEMSIDGSYDQDTREVDITINVNAVDDPGISLRIFYGIAEDSIYFNAPNNLDWHHQTFRDFLTSASGDPVTYEQGESYSYSETFTLNNSYDWEQTFIFAFVQDYAHRDIKQGAKAYLKDMFSSVAIDMIPDDDPVIVNPGGHFTYTGVLTNNENLFQWVDVWVMIDVPGYGMYRPVMRVNNVFMNPYETLTVPNIRQNVPNIAPAGDYNYMAYCGDFDTNVIDEAAFPFTVAAGRSGDADSWNAEGWSDGLGNVVSEAIITNAYPNPFNASTQISFNLVDESKVTLEVFDLMGRKVSTLANGSYSAGNHNVNWDASQYASGVYFYKLSTDNETITKRITLVK